MRQLRQGDVVRLPTHRRKVPSFKDSVRLILSLPERGFRVQHSKTCSKFFFLSPLPRCS